MPVWHVALVRAGPLPESVHWLLRFTWITNRLIADSFYLDKNPVDVTRCG